MSSVQIARDILWNDCLKVVIIEPSTGAYEVVRSTDEASEEKLKGAKDIYAYCQMMAENWLIHPDDMRPYLLHLRGMLSVDMKDRLDGSRFSRKLRYRVGDSYMWTTFEILYPEGYPVKAHSCVFTIRRADTSRIDYADRPLIDISNLAKNFIKVLKVNIEDESYEIFKLPDGPDEDEPESRNISNWLDAFAASRAIHQDDIDTFTEFTRLDRIRDAFRASRAPQKCRYRRRVGDAYRWVVMELVPSVEYTSTNPTVMLFIKDIDEIPDAKAASRHKAAASEGQVDSLTGLKGSKAFQNALADVDDRPDKRGVGILVTSLNRLAYVIGSHGREAGDSLIMELCEKLTGIFLESTCYRTSVDEFAVIQPDVMHTSFSKWTRDLKESIARELPPIASVGYAWEEFPQSTGDMLTRAEQMMMAERSAFEEKYPKHSQE